MGNANRSAPIVLTRTLSYRIYRRQRLMNKKKISWLCIGIKKSKNEALSFADDRRDSHKLPWVVVMEYDADSKQSRKVYERHGKFVRSK